MDTCVRKLLILLTFTMTIGAYNRRSLGRAIWLDVKHSPDPQNVKKNPVADAGVRDFPLSHARV